MDIADIKPGVLIKFGKESDIPWYLLILSLEDITNENVIFVSAIEYDEENRLKGLPYAELQRNFRIHPRLWELVKR